MRTPSRLRPTVPFRYSPLVGALACALGSQVALGSVVTSGADIGTGTLREVLENYDEICPASDTITFSGPFTISIASALPVITCPNISIQGGGVTTIEKIASGYVSPPTVCHALSANAVTPTAISGVEVRNFANGASICGYVSLLNVNLHDSQYGVSAQSGSTIGSSQIYSNLYGVVFDDNSTIDSSDVYGNAYGVLASSNATITNNTIHDNSTAGVHAYNGATIRGNHIHHNTSYGIQSDGDDTIIGGPAPADRNYVYSNGTGIYVSYGGTVEGNYIGTLDGTTAAGNTSGGIVVVSDAVIRNNVISGNTGTGIYVYDQDGTVIQGNFIGTNALGNAGLGNTAYGIYFNYSYGGALIDNNAIAANGSAAISINSAAVGNGTTNITTNRIGMSNDGTVPLGNASGIDATCSTGVYITSNNVISANTAGKAINFAGVTNSRIWSNKIGVASDATTSRPNQMGVALAATSACGGLTASTGVYMYGNTIANNTTDGVLISSSGNPAIENVGNRIQENSIYANGAKNINLDLTGGPVLNDGMDVDTGPNRRQNHPLISSVAQGGGTTVINYTLNSTPGSTFDIDFFANTGGGTPAAKQYLGNATTPATDGSGNTAGTRTFAGTFSFISATATDRTTLDTSEISPIFSLSPDPAVSILPASPIDFGNVPTGGSSATQPITLRSSGNVAYRMSKIFSAPSCYGGPVCGATGDFVCTTGTCATSTDYAPVTSPAVSCTLNATFQPNTLGPKTLTFYICDNAAGTPRAITLTGTGVVPPPITISPSSFDFGAVLVGSTGESKIFTIANPGSGPLPIGPVTASPNFKVVLTTCTSAIPPNSSCIAEVGFAPAQPGPLTGFLTVGSSTSPMEPASAAGKSMGAKAGPLGLVSVPLSGTGTQAAALDLPSAIDLGSFLVGSASPITKLVELRNNGNAVLTLGSITLTGPFTLVNPCPINLAPGASCTLTLGFSTTTRGEFDGTLTVMSSAQGGSRVIPVTARSQLVAAPVIKVTPSFIGFGQRLAGTPSVSQRITVSNVGGVDAILGPITADIDFLVVGTSCGLTLAQSSTCFADVALRPVGFGPRVGVVRVTSNAEGSPHEVNLLGTGCRPFLATANRLGTRSNCSP